MNISGMPVVPALLIIDSCNPEEPVLVKLLEIAYLHAELPKKSMVFVTPSGMLRDSCL
jgi:hypothetical protein